MGTILGKGFAQAQVHTEFIAREPKAPVCYELYAWVCILGWVKSLVSRYIEGYSFLGIWGP